MVASKVCWLKPRRSIPVASIRGVAAVAAFAAVVAFPGVARADDIDARLDAFENEARQLARQLPRPNQTSRSSGQRRLVDAQVAYSLGDYAKASLALFELASTPGPDREVASFYLAESLFQKGDRGAARTYYEQVVASGN